MDGILGRSGPGDRGGSHPCCLDSLIVSKSAHSQATCVFGDSTDAGQNLHGIQVTDYLLGNLLKSERYDRVVAMCLDRRMEVVHAAARQYLEKECEEKTMERCLSKLSLSTMSPMDTTPWTHGHDYSTCTNNMCTVVAKKIKELVQERDTTTTDRNRPIAVAVVVYSLSELMLSWGINPTLHFVQAMKTTANEQDHSGVGTISGASLSSGAVSVSVIALVHTTLHPPHILSRLLPQHHHQSASSSSGSSLPFGFNCAVFVRANDGTLSEELACEVQGIRVSTVTGKVTEEQDYFRRIIPNNVVSGTATGPGFGAGVLAQGPSLSLLTPVMKLSKTSTSTSSSATGATAGTSTSGTRGTDTISLPTTATTSATFNPPSTPSSSSLPTDSMVSNTTMNQRWISFDSTDPEFDDDSDPDADLDL